MPKPPAKAPRASTSALPKAPSRKRQTQQSDDESLPTPLTANPDSLGLGTAELAFGSDDELDEDEAEIASAASGDEDEFPEIDDQEGSEEDEEYESGEEEDEDEEDDEAALLAELQAEEDESNSSEDGSDLDEFIRRHTVKPDERDAETIKHDQWDDKDLLPGYMARSHIETSKITGQDITVWDDEIDAGYGSDSSTEEVSTPTPAAALPLALR